MRPRTMLGQALALAVPLCAAEGLMACQIVCFTTGMRACSRGVPIGASGRDHLEPSGVYGMRTAVRIHDGSRSSPPPRPHSCRHLGGGRVTAQSWAAENTGRSHGRTLFALSESSPADEAWRRARAQCPASEATS